MLLPAMGFLLGCISFCVLGLILLPNFSLPVTTTNLVGFIIGAFPGALAAGSLYGWMFADANNQLVSDFSVRGFFAALLLGATAGGLLLSWLVRTSITFHGKQGKL